MKPYHSLVLLIYVTIILFALSYFAPEGVISLNGYDLKVFRPKDLFPENTHTPAKDISAIVAIGEVDTAAVLVESDSAVSASLDSTKQQATDSTQAKELELDPNLHIQFPDSNPAVLYNFFAALDSIPQKHQVIRALHIGDSQIEGDRITSFLRHRFQKQFGGCGVGLVPVFEMTDARQTIEPRADAHWIKYAAYGAAGRRPIHNYFSPMASYFRFYPLRTVTRSDTAEGDSTPTFTTRSVPSVKAQGQWTTADVKYTISSRYYPLNGKVEQIKLFYRNEANPFELVVKADKDSLASEHFEPQTGLSVYQHNVDKTPRTFKFTFKGSYSPDVYGVCFDCKEGIAFDNIPLRGSSGLEFSKGNTAFLKQQLNALNTRFLILQFGVNVVPNEVKSYQFYEDALYKQLQILRAASPNLTILVIGLSDMSKRVNGEYVSYGNITKIRDAQRNAAFKAGCAFWDLYEAMGGENSMPSWVNARPSLAAKDYTHFSPRGAQIVAEMLYKSLILEYNQYHHRKKRGLIQ